MVLVALFNNLMPSQINQIGDCLKNLTFIHIEQVRNSLSKGINYY